MKPKDDTQPTVHPTVHCWTPTSDLYVGSEEGFFLKIGADTFKAIIVYQTPSPDTKGEKELQAMIVPRFLGRMGGTMDNVHLPVQTTC